VKSVAGGRTIFTLSVMPASLFEDDIAAETEFGILLKGNDWSNGQTTDHIATFWSGNFELKLTAPVQETFFGSEGDELSITAETRWPLTISYLQMAT